jgi:hypothetical protein
MRHKLLTATLFAATVVPGGQAEEPAPEKQVAALSEQHRLAAIKGVERQLAEPLYGHHSQNRAP